MIGFRPTVEQVVRELKLLGFSDIRKVVSWRNELVTRTEKGEDGEPVMVMMPRVTIVDADKISDEAAAAVAEVSQTVNGVLRVGPTVAATISKKRSASPVDFCPLIARIRGRVHHLNVA